MSKHTPRPWIIKPISGKPYHYEIVAGGIQIATVFGRANAKLIVVTLDLLEALREIDKRTTFFSRHSNQDSYTELNKIAKQAIKKAEGQK